MTVYNILITGVVVIAFLVIAVALFLVVLYAGFRMGRKTIGKPEAPIISKNVTTMRLVEEDPFFKPFTGRDQPNVPTIKESKK